MNNLELLARTYTISLQPSSFHAEPDAADEAPMLLCRIGLAGKIDRHWINAFYEAQWDRIEHFEFRLFEDGESIEFLAPRDGAADGVKRRLAALRSFLDTVNSNANRLFRAVTDCFPAAGEPLLALTA